MRSRSAYITVLLVAGVLVLDIALPLGVAAGIGYALAVAYVIFRGAGNRVIVLTAATGTVLVVLGLWFSPGGQQWEKILTNRFLSIGVVWGIAVLGHRRNRLASSLRSKETALHESERRFKCLFERAPIGLLFLDGEYRIVEVNDAFAELVSSSAEELVGTQFHDLVHEEDLQTYADVISRIDGGSNEDSSEELRLVVREELPLWVQFTCFVVDRTGEGGRTCVGAVEDIDVRKRVERERSRYADRLEILRDIDRAILEARSVTEVSEGTVNRLVETVECERVCVSLFDFEEEKVRIAAVNDRDGREARHVVDLEHFGLPPSVRGGDLFIDQEIEGVPDWGESSFLFRASRPIASLLTVPLEVEGDVLGALTFVDERPHAFRSHDLQVAREVADSLAVGIHHLQLVDEIRAARTHMEELSRRLVEMQERERRHLGLELHDEIGQKLTMLRLLLEGCSEGDTADETLEEAREQVARITDKVRNLSKDLRPPMLDDLGLLPTLVWHFDRFEDRTGIEVEFEHGGLSEERFRSDLETTAYRIVQEALTNVARHAQVDTVRVRVWVDGNWLRLVVEDRGRGFDPESVNLSTGMTGVSGMKERAGLVGGELEIETAPESGTRIEVRLPVEVQVTEEASSLEL